MLPFAVFHAPILRVPSAVLRRVLSRSFRRLSGPRAVCSSRLPALLTGRVARMMPKRAGIRW